MAALKYHLFTNPNTEDNGTSGSDAQSASLLPTDYGRFLHPTTMSQDAFYSLNEVFSFAASSQMAFLNLIDVKLDKYTSLPETVQYQSLPSLKFTKQILYRYIQKTQRILDSIKNAKNSRWPRDRSESGHRKAVTAASSLEQDFEHLLNRAKILHQHVTESITVLMSSMSISESQKAIEQAQRVGKLTFLAFIFVPLSFTCSFFGMNVTQIQEGSILGLQEWAALTVSVFAAAIALYYVDIVTPMQRLWQSYRYS
ncbi:hypothetical protein F5Y12DRAFT_796016 [Xylaria sp. FL1777]|nr:hypothetical protein F5Y12DRAFT_796016 [Xylaria sp. FL1777]